MRRAPHGRDVRSHTLREGVLSLTFKHAVEFSSFGCAPRSGSRLRLGQLDLLYPALRSVSNRAWSQFPSAPSAGSWWLLARRRTRPLLGEVGFPPARPLRITPGRPSHREGLLYVTGPCSRCQTEPSGPPRPLQGPGLGGSWHGGTPYPSCFGLGSFRPVRPGSLRAVRLTEKAW